MNVLLGGSCIAVLFGVFVPFFGPQLVTQLFVWAHTPHAEQKRSIPVHGPVIAGNLVRDELPVTAFITDDQIDWLEKDFTHRPGDVWVTTYAKVGTTWTQYIVSLLSGRTVDGMLSLFESCPWAEVALGMLKPSKESLQAPSTIPGQPRCFKSHWWNRDHMAIDKLPEASKVIYVYRDAESVFKSYFHHVFNLYGMYRVTAEDFKDGNSWDGLFDMFIHGELDFGCYFNHVAGWWKAKDRPNVLLVRFEDLKNHHVDSIRNISKFIGVDADETLVEHVRHLSSFDEMKKLFAEDMVQKFLKWAGIFRGDHIRSGGNDKEKSPFSPAQLQQLQQKYKEILEPLGVPREYMLKHKLP